MGFLNFPWGWLLVGILATSGVWWLATWLRSRKISLRWYEWLVGVIATLL
ncbi:putative reductive dehalogenase anchoring protein (rdhB), partial [marine sediment metagenome]